MHKDMYRNLFIPWSVIENTDKAVLRMLRQELIPLILLLKPRKGVGWGGNLSMK